jgi:hypothetical protein
VRPELLSDCLSPLSSRLSTPLTPFLSRSHPVVSLHSHPSTVCFELHVNSREFEKPKGTGMVPPMRISGYMQKKTRFSMGSGLYTLQSCRSLPRQSLVDLDDRGDMSAGANAEETKSHWESLMNQMRSWTWLPRSKVVWRAGARHLHKLKEFRRHRSLEEWLRRGCVTRLLGFEVCVPTVRCRITYLLGILRTAQCSQQTR